MRALDQENGRTVPVSLVSHETRGRSSAGRAPALHAGGQEFDPPRLHQYQRCAPADGGWYRRLTAIDGSKLEGSKPVQPKAATPHDKKSYCLALHKHQASCLTMELMRSRVIGSG